MDRELACNVNIYSHHAAGLTPLLYGAEDPAHPLVVSDLDPTGWRG